MRKEPAENEIHDEEKGPESESRYQKSAHARYFSAEISVLGAFCGRLLQMKI